MLEMVAAEMWYNQAVYIPVGYLIIGIILALFVPANQIVAIMIAKLPGDYELQIKEKE